MRPRRASLALLGTSLALLVLAWAVVRDVGVEAALLVGVLAVVLLTASVAVAAQSQGGRFDGSGGSSGWDSEVEDDQAP